ncbi:unnamed protein product [Linum tenue]|uniref:Uncharacterized protein n=1 Tax=Linum tenue TaxID=586396 RepID=A0AAV0KZR5_9ROSI|nr:unnamed protein product [Linum tenue]
MRRTPRLRRPWRISPSSTFPW